MRTAEADGEQRHEIIIVRRGRNDEDDGHHGGVWKIAFADFMTALMCFFLVMWLINAANEETRAALASYFNPVKLIDRNSSRKGLDELGGPQSIESTPENLQDSESEKLTEPGSSLPNANPAPSQQQSNSGPRSDEHLFSDPFAVLAEIAAETGALQNTSAKGDGGAQDAGPASGASGGESYRDPFAPDFWSQHVNVPDAAATMQPVGAEASESQEAGQPAERQPLPADAKDMNPEAPIGEESEALSAAADAVAAALDPVPPSQKAEVTSDPLPATAMAAETEEPGASAKADEAKETQTARSETEMAAEAAKAAEQKAEADEKTAEAIRQELAEAVGHSGELMEGITVTVTEDGVMISITDEFDSGMFEIGSAVPRRDLVIAMEKIGKILGERKGEVTINGHTDGRPFKSETYDNWRLSTARAHSAYFMLVRGGLDERRIVEVAGFADRKLMVADDPFADANRRIEILLENGG